MMRIALALLLCVATSAWAHDPGDSGINIEYSDGNIIEPNATTLAFDGSTLSASIDGSGRVVLTTGPLVTLLGQTIGDTAAEFASTVVFDGRTIDFDAVTDIMWPEPLILDTTNVGGTTTTSVLKLNPTSNATYAAGATIELCEAAPSTSGSVNCMTVAPDGVSLATSSTIFSAFQAAFTATQTTDALIAGSFPSVFGLNFSPGLSITNSSIGGTGLGAIVGVLSSPSVTNGTDDNYSGATSVSYAGGFTSSRTSTGTLGITKVNVFQSQITAPAASITYTDARDHQALEISGTVNGTLTRHWGFVSEAFTKGTNAMPFAAGKVSAPTGTPPTGYGSWGVETGVTTDADRFYYKNAAGQIHRLGQFCMTGTGTGISNSANRFMFPDTRAAVDATETNADVPVPAAMKWVSLACGVVTPVGTSSHSLTMTVRDDAADVTGSSCAISNSATCPTGCTCTARSETGVSIASGSQLSIKIAPANTPTVTDGELTCTACYVIDAY